MRKTTATITGKGKKQTITTADGTSGPFHGRVYPFMIWASNMLFMVQGCQTIEAAEKAAKRYRYAEGYVIVEIKEG